jgi:hypothetical protein
MSMKETCLIPVARAGFPGSRYRAWAPQPPDSQKQPQTEDLYQQNRKPNWTIRA